MAQIRSIVKIAACAALFICAVTEKSAANETLLGTTQDGTRIVLQGRSLAERQRVLEIAQRANQVQPRNADEFVRRMRRSCQGRVAGAAGVIGAGMMFGRELIEEFPQEYGGDLIGFSTSKILAAPDEPGWFIHWAESVATSDYMLQIGIAVAAQTGITSMVPGLMSDVCAYYMLPNRTKLPIPIVDPGTGRLQMTTEEATIVRRMYSRIRMRRALVNGGAMGVGMVLGRYVIEAKNDPALRRCMALRVHKRWGAPEEFAEYHNVCQQAARNWLSRSRGADLTSAIVSSLISGVGTYAVREAATHAIVNGGSAATRQLDRTQLVQYLYEKMAGRRSVRPTERTLRAVINGIKVFRRTWRGNLIFEIAVESVTAIYVSYAEEHIVRPFIQPMFEESAFKAEMREQIRKLENGLTISMQNGQYSAADYMQIGDPGFGPRMYQRTERRIDPTEVAINNIVHTNRKWRETTSYDANAIRQNWMDTVRYPDNVVNSGFTFYKKLLELGSHDALMPAPVVWDFFSNRNSPFKNQATAAARAFAGNREKIDTVKYELERLYVIGTKLQTAEGRQELLNDNLVTREVANRVATPQGLQALARDNERIMQAGRAIALAHAGENAQANVIVGLTTMLELVNDANSVFAFPEVYRVTQRAPRGFFLEIADDLLNAMSVGTSGAANGSNSCGQVSSQSRQALVKGYMPYSDSPSGAQLNTSWNFYLCDSRNNQRYAFAKAVYPNRIYRVLNQQLGYPFKLRPSVEDLELLLNEEDPSIYAANDLDALANGDGGTYGARSKAQLRRKIDLFVNRLLCGAPLSATYVAANDVPILSNLTGTPLEGMRVQTGLPRIAMDLDGNPSSLPIVCRMREGGSMRHLTVAPNPVDPLPYVDYFTKDFAYANQGSVAPLRTRLKESAMFNRDYRTPFVSQAYMDFLDLASRRIQTNFLRDPNSFEQLWNSRIQGPYQSFIQNRDWQNRYEATLNQTVRSMGIIWKRQGDYSKCQYRSFADLNRCQTTNVYDGSALLSPYRTLVATNSLVDYSFNTNHPFGQSVARSIEHDLDAWASRNLDKPLDTFFEESGRGLYVSTSAEILLAGRAIYKLAKFYEQRWNQGTGPQDVSARQLKQIKYSLRKLALMSQLIWQMIDENNPAPGQACNGCKSSNQVAIEMVESFLIHAGDRTSRTQYRASQHVFADRMRDGSQPDAPTTNGPEAGAPVTAGDQGVDASLANLVAHLGSTTQKPLGTISNQFPDLVTKMQRTDAVFKTAMAAAMIHSQAAIDEIRFALATLKHTGPETPACRPESNEAVTASSPDPACDGYVNRTLAENQHVVLGANEDFILRWMKGVFTEMLDTKALFDAFKIGDGDPQIAQAFAPIESLAQEVKLYTEGAFYGDTEMDCWDRLALDGVYGQRPDLARSVECAHQNGNMRELTRESIDQFDRQVQ